MLIIITAVTGSVLFIFAGQLNFEFAFYFAIPCMIAALIGSNYINEYIRRTKKASMLLFGFLMVTIFSLFLLILSTFNNVDTDKRGLFEIESYCN